MENFTSQTIKYHFSRQDLYQAAQPRNQSRETEVRQGWRRIGKSRIVVLFSSNKVSGLLFEVIESDVTITISIEI